MVSKIIKNANRFPLDFSDSSIKDPSQMLPRNCHFLGWPIGSVLAQQEEFQEKLPGASSGALLKPHWLGTRNAGESLVVGVVKNK